MDPVPEPLPERPPGHLLTNLLLFGRLLRGLGLAVDPGRLVDLHGALSRIGLGRKGDVRAAARSLLVQRHEDIPVFDAAFEVFWRRPREGRSSRDLRALGERRHFKPPRFAPPDARRSQAEDAEAAGAAKESVLQAVQTYAAAEVLRHKDFGEMTPEELRDVQEIMAALVWRMRQRRSRRMRPGRGRDADLRRSVRGSLRLGGELLRWERRRRKDKPRPLVVLADVSGSMERYTRALLLFMYGLAEGIGSRVEAFVFATRLTRITQPLRGHDLDRALREVARSVPDWSGGTRIGDALHAFNFRWARRALSGSAVVLLVSDGWDRGEPERLGSEMERLQRSCHRLVWLNPLLGSPGFEPLTRGLQAALPFVDDFLPVRDLASLEALARLLAGLDQRRRERRQRAPAFGPRPIGA